MLAVPALAGDIIVTPTGNQFEMGAVEVNAIGWGQSNTMAQDVLVGEAFSGVTDPSTQRNGRRSWQSRARINLPALYRRRPIRSTYRIRGARP